MTKADAIKELEQMSVTDDIDNAHERADAILCEYLSSIGDDDLAKAFTDARQRLDFWYA